MGRYFSIILLSILISSSAAAQSNIDPNDGVALCALGKSGLFVTDLFPASKSGRTQVSRASFAFDATYYHLSLDVDRDKRPILSGVVTVTGRVSESLSVLDLDMSNNLAALWVEDEDGTPLSYTHNDNTLSTTLDTPPLAGETVTIRIAYEGNPVNTGFGTFVHGTVSGNPFVWTLSEPYGAREWWPNVDHPADKADSVRITVRVPELLRVGSNGLLVNETVNGDGTATYDWLHRYPISSYLVSFSVGRYDVYEQTYDRPAELEAEYGPLSLPILHYAYAGTNLFQGNGAQNGWNYVTEILPVFEDWFGPYPFSAEKYGHASTTFGGGMEHQTMTSMGGNGWGLVAHELAHMWYGDMITNRRWPHLWLHEGFATMAELLFWRSDPGRYGSSYSNIFNLYYERAQTAEGTLVLQDTSQVGTMFSHARVYSKGGMVLYMMKEMLGDDVFREVLHAYGTDPAVQYGTAETADFERVASAVSGRDLSTFFRQWVTEGTGYPSYEVRWRPSTTDTGPAVKIELRQTQTAAQSNISAFEMPVFVRVYTRSGDQIITLQNNQRIQTFDLPLSDDAIRIDVDPGRSILRDLEMPVSRLPAPASFDWSVYPNPAEDLLRLRFDLPDPTNVTVRLIDASGRRVRSFDLGHFDAGDFLRALDLPATLASGMYVVEFSTRDRDVSQTVVVIR